MELTNKSIELKKDKRYTESLLKILRGSDCKYEGKEDITEGYINIDDNLNISFNKDKKYELLDNFDVAMLGLELLEKTIRKYLGEKEEEHVFQPFEQVLVRDFDNEIWQCSLFSHYEKSTEHSFNTLSGIWVQCVPYIGNEHLLNTKEQVL